MRVHGHVKNCGNICALIKGHPGNMPEWIFRIACFIREMRIEMNHLFFGNSGIFKQNLAGEFFCLFLRNRLIIRQPNGPDIYAGISKKLLPDIF